MPSLPELQMAFSAALLFGETADIEPYVVSNGVEPAARLRIYRNNTRENFLAALHASFPVLERLVGGDYFRQLAGDYMQRFPSPSGNLHHIGEQLAAYLEHRFAATEYAYLQDIARLEWACQEVLVAPEHPPLDPQRLAGIEPEGYGDLGFTLHPATRLVESAYPILRIWSANQPGGDADQIIDLRQGGERVLLRRTADSVELLALGTADFAFLSAIAAGESLARAAEAAAGDSISEFDLGRALRHFVGAGVIVDFHLWLAN
jgi:hypothetical protein